MTDWSGALAKAFKIHRDPRCFRGFPVSGPENRPTINVLSSIYEKPRPATLSVSVVSGPSPSRPETAETTKSAPPVSTPVCPKLAQDSGLYRARNTGNTGNTDFPKDQGFERNDFEERAAIVEHDAGAPREWAEGFGRLNVEAPLVGFSKELWEQLIDDGGRFIDKWAHEAARLGWEPLDVFGIAPSAPVEPYRNVGLVFLIAGGDVMGIAPGRATIRRKDGGLVTYLKRTPAEIQALWDAIEHSDGITKLGPPE